MHYTHMSYAGVTAYDLVVHKLHKTLHIRYTLVNVLHCATFSETRVNTIHGVMLTLNN
jgi:hypothetical protein